MRISQAAQIRNGHMTGILDVNHFWGVGKGGRHRFIAHRPVARSTSHTESVNECIERSCSWLDWCFVPCSPQVSTVCRTIVLAGSRCQFPCRRHRCLPPKRSHPSAQTIMLQDDTVTVEEIAFPDNHTGGIFDGSLTPHLDENRRHGLGRAARERAQPCRAAGESRLRFG